MSDTLHVTCPSCTAVNRVISERIRQTPSCGKCGSLLLPARPIELDGPALGRFLAKNDLPVLVDFWSSTCGPCRMMAPEFEQAAAHLGPSMRLVKMETLANQNEAMRYNIRSVPTLILFRKGRETARISGALPAQEIVNWVQLQA